MLDIDHVYPPHFISQNSNMILKPEAHLATHAQLHDLLNDNAAPLCAILSTEHQCQLKNTDLHFGHLFHQLPTGHVFHLQTKRRKEI